MDLKPLEDLLRASAVCVINGLILYLWIVLQYHITGFCLITSVLILEIQLQVVSTRTNNDICRKQESEIDKNIASCLEKFTIVWLDVDIERNGDSIDTIRRLKTITNYLKTFRDAKECIDYISSITFETVILVVSGSLGKIVIPIIQNLQQIAFIYVFCLDKNTHETWAMNSDNKKVRGVFIDKQSLLEKIVEDTDILLVDVMPMNIFSSHHDEKSIRALDKESALYVWNQLLLDVLLRIPTSDISKLDMLVVCQSFYRDNNSELKKIFEFRSNYSAETAISWYTRDSFIYRLLNKALRTRDINVIFKFRFFIADLYSQLSKEHCKFIEPLLTDDGTVGEYILTVYRGQYLKSDELQTLKDNIGELISMNTFVSTTYDKDVAKIFAGDGSKSLLLESVLFEILIRTNVTTKPYANIKNVSFMKDENEVLFSMGTVFQIESILEESENKGWIVKLVLVSEQNEQLKQLATQIKEKSDDGNDLNTLGHLLLQMGELDKAEQYFQMLIDNTAPNDPDIWIFYQNLAVVYDNKADFAQAMEYYKKAMRLRLTCNVDDCDDEDTVDEPNASEKTSLIYRSKGDYSTTYNNVGLAYQHMGRYPEAFTLYNKALNITLRTLSVTYHNIAGLHRIQGEYSKALENSEKSLEIDTKMFGSDYPELGSTYTTIGLIYQEKGNFIQALKYHEMALAIQIRTLGVGHSSVGLTYNNIALTYQDKGNFSASEEYYEKALEIFLKTPSLNYTYLAALYNNLGLVRREMGDYLKALEYCEKAIDIQLKLLGPNHSDLSTSYNNIGLIQHGKGDCNSAMKYYRKSLDITVSNFGETHPSVGTSYNNIGTVYETMEECPQALDFFEKSLAIRIKTLGADHPDVSMVYSNMGASYFKMNNDKQALECFDKALKIQMNIFDSNHPSIFSTNNNLGNVYQNMRDYPKALSYYEKALQSKLEMFGSSYPGLVTAYSNIGAVYCNMGDTSKALEFYENALKLLSSQHESNYPELASVYNNLGALYYKLNDTPQAIEYYEETLKNQLKFLTSNNQNIYLTYKYLASSYHANGEYSRAQEYLEKIMDSQPTAIGSNQLELISIYEDVAKIYYDMLNNERALESYNRIVEIQLQIVGAHNLELANTYNTMGVICQRMTENSQALEYFKKALGIYFDVLDPDHSNLAVTYNNMGAICYKLDDYLTAIEYYMNALRIQTLNLGESHPSVVKLCENIAGLYHITQEPTKALEYYHKVLELRQSDASDHFKLATIYNKIAIIYLELNDFLNAVKYFEQTLEVYVHFLVDPDDPSLAPLHNNTGICFHQIGEYSKALACFKQSLEIELKHPGPDHSSLCTTYCNIGFLHKIQKEYTEALNVFEKALDLAQKTFPSEHPFIFEYETQVASIRELLPTNTEEITDATAPQ